MSQRIFILGTDTDVGKTITSCALLHALQERGHRALPFKPAASGPKDATSDTQQLIRSCRLPLQAAEVTPLHFHESLAPGVAENPAPFLNHTAQAKPNGPPDVLRQMEAHLSGLERRHRPTLTLIEGAGGLLVPMPGGSWQDQWIDCFKARILLVGRAGLGTINHTLLTIEALEKRGHNALGFILNHGAQPQASSPQLAAQNASMITARTKLPHFGTLPTLDHHAPWPKSDSWLHANFWSALALQPSDP